MPEKPKVSITIVYYRKIKDLFRCLESILKSCPKVSFEIIVIDNSGEERVEEKIADQYLNIKYINSGKNIGFGAGQNMGATYAKGEYLLILNPDTKIYSGTLGRLVNHLENNPKVGIAAPTLIDVNGGPYEIQGTGDLNPWAGIVALSFINKLVKNNPISKKYWLSEKDNSDVKTVSFVQGSAFLMRKNLFDKLGGFDERFFLYFEDNDLCKRIIDSGLKINILSKAKVMHLWGGGTPKTKNIKRIFAQSRFKYFHKHYGIVWATIIGFIASLSKWHLILLLIVVLVFILKFI